jgi:hypothetical protein
MTAIVGVWEKLSGSSGEGGSNKPPSGSLDPKEKVGYAPAELGRAMGVKVGVLLGTEEVEADEEVLLT